MCFYVERMAASETTRRATPKWVRELPFHERWRWARKTSRLSHDRIVELMGRSNRSHLIKIEKQIVMPRHELRDAYADATNVARDLFTDEEAARPGDPFRGDDGSAPGVEGVAGLGRGSSGGAGVSAGAGDATGDLAA